MTLSILLSVTLILGISFAVTRKNLDIFEILFMWMIIIVIHYNFVTITTLNMKLFENSDRMPNYFPLVFERIFLIPLLIIFFIERMADHRSYYRWLWLPFAVLLLTGIEYLGMSLHLITFVRWKLWWSLVEWVTLFLLIYCLWLWYRGLMKREINKYASTADTH